MTRHWPCSVPQCNGHAENFVTTLATQTTWLRCVKHTPKGDHVAVENIEEFERRVLEPKQEEPTPWWEATATVVGRVA